MSSVLTINDSNHNEYFLPGDNVLNTEGLTDDDLKPEEIIERDLIIDKIVDKRSYELTGLSLGELIDDIAEGLNVIPGAEARDIDDILDACDGRQLLVLAYVIGVYHYDSSPIFDEDTIYPKNLELIVLRLFREIYFSLTRNAHLHRNTGLVTKIFSELPKRLELDWITNQV